MTIPFEPTAGRRPWRGFTTIELMVALAVTAVLSSVAYPAFSEQVDKARRADAIAVLTNAQMAEEQWRANQPLYARLAELGIAAVSASGRYTLQVMAHSVDSYELLASAQGMQSRDISCSHMRLAMHGGNPSYDSGPDPTVANPPDANRKCWSL